MGKGKPQADVSVSDVAVSRCRCGSTRRTDYHNITKQPIEGLTADGKPYNLVVWRRTECLDCGQHRADRSYEYHPPIP